MPNGIQARQRPLTPPCARAVDPPKPTDDAREYEKAELEARYREQVAELAYGEDADALGGLTLDRNFARYFQSPGSIPSPSSLLRGNIPQQVNNQHLVPLLVQDSWDEVRIQASMLPSQECFVRRHSPCKLSNSVTLFL